MTPTDFKVARATLGLSASQMARALDVHRATVSKWEAGERAIPGPVEVLVRHWLECPWCLD